MVFFTCDACGESLKKNQVEKHYNNKCRRCSVLTCVDCQKDFPGDSYKSHTKCITEDEKYGGKNYQAKSNANKGEKKQNAWLVQLQELVASSASNLDDDVKTALNTIMTFENIPRKRAKFFNFAKNVLGGGRRSSPSTLEKVWDLFEQAQKNPSTPIKHETTSEGKPDGEKAEGGGKRKTKGAKADAGSVGEQADGPQRKKRKKLQRQQEKENEGVVEEAEVENASAEAVKEWEKPTKFKWEDVIVRVLREKGPEVKMSKLRRKVLSEYGRQQEVEIDESKRVKLEAKLDKKLVKNKLFKVMKNKVSLSTSRDGKPEEEECQQKDAAGSFNRWESADLGDKAANEKFRRLMGLGGKSAPSGPAKISDAGLSSVGSKSSVAQMLANQEQQFERVREANHKQKKGGGLGFASKAKNSVVKFDE